MERLACVLSGGSPAETTRAASGGLAGLRLTSGSSLTRPSQAERVPTRGPPVALFTASFPTRIRSGNQAKLGGSSGRSVTSESRVVSREVAGLPFWCSRVALARPRSLPPVRTWAEVLDAAWRVTRRPEESRMRLRPSHVRPVQRSAPPSSPPETGTPQRVLMDPLRPRAAARARNRNG